MSDSISRSEFKELSRENLAALKEVSGELYESRLAQAQLAMDLKQRERDTNELRDLFKQEIFDLKTELSRQTKALRDEREREFKRLKDERDKAIKELKDWRETDRRFVGQINEQVIVFLAKNQGAEKTSADFWVKFFQWSALIGLVIGGVTGIVFGVISALK